MGSWLEIGASTIQDQLNEVSFSFLGQTLAPKQERKTTHCSFGQVGTPLLWQLWWVLAMSQCQLSTIQVFCRDGLFAMSKVQQSRVVALSFLWLLGHRCHHECVPRLGPIHSVIGIERPTSLFHLVIRVERPTSPFHLGQPWCLSYWEHIKVNEVRFQNREPTQGSNSSSVIYFPPLLKWQATLKALQYIHLHTTKTNGITQLNQFQHIHKRWNLQGFELPSPTCDIQVRFD